MIYEIEKDLKVQIKNAGLTARDVANFLNCSPSTVSGKLNGFSSLTIAERKIIERRITALRLTQNDSVKRG